MDIRPVQTIKPHCPAIILFHPLLLLLYSLYRIGISQQPANLTSHRINI